jgi:DNA-binding NarL/FixJ family response regulator
VTTRVLLVDDERLIRAGFRMILSDEPDIALVGEASDGMQAIAEVGRLHPDVVLMDVRMPRLDGLEAARRILGTTDAPTRVIMLTTFDLDEYVYHALRAGASGFLLKDAPEAQLIAAIHVVAAGGSIFAPHATRRLVEAFARVPPSPPAGLPDLTPRELDVLRLMARGESNREIATALGVSEHTAKSHVAHILDKLGLRDRVQAVVLAYEAGVVRPGEGPESPPPADATR